MKNQLVFILLILFSISNFTISKRFKRKSSSNLKKGFYPVIDPKKYQCAFGCSECKGRCCYSGYCLSTNAGGYSCMYFCKQPDITNFDLVPRFKSKAYLFQNAKNKEELVKKEE